MNQLKIIHMNVTKKRTEFFMKNIFKSVLVLILVVLMLFFSLLSINKESENKETVQNDAKSIATRSEVYKKTVFAVYNEKIIEYEKAANVGLDALDERWYDDSSINSESIRAYYNDENKSLAYTLYDIDGNGVSELVFSNLFNQTIYDIYTIDNGQLVKIFKDACFGDRSRLHILSHGRLLTEGAHNAFESSMEIHTIEDGSELLVNEAYYFNTREDASEYCGNGKEISVDQYIEKLKQFESESIFNELNWIIFVE